MGITRTQNIPVEGTKHHGFQTADLNLRRADVPLDQLVPALAKNGRDEVVFESPDKKLYVLDAVKLTGGAQVGEQIKVGAYSGKVVHVDVDQPRAGGWASVGLMAGSILGGPILAKIAMAAGLIDPATATYLATAAVAGGFVGAPLVEHRGPDDAALSNVSTTIASAPSGNIEDLEAKL